MGVARMEFQLATTANLLSLLRESFRVFCLRWPGSGFIKLVRETLSKNEVLPGLTYFYCNWVSQGGNVLLGCESEKRSRTVAAVRKTTLRLSLRASFLEEREKWRTPRFFGQC
jgi:hypothetical protein